MRRRPKTTDFLDFDPAASTPVVRGTLGGGLEAVRVAVPADVRIAAGRLEWIPAGQDGEWWPEGGNATKALDAFLNLATEQREERFSSFARKYGVLGLNESGVPACGSANLHDDPPQLSESWQGCAVSWEPLAAYRHYATGAKAMLCLAAALRRARGEEVVYPRGLFLSTGLEVDPVGYWNRIRVVCKEWQELSGRTWEEWAESRVGHAAIHNLIAIDTAHIVENFTHSEELFGPLEDPMEYARSQRQKFGYWITRFWLNRAGLVPTVTWSEDRPTLGLSVGRPREDLFEYWPPNSLFRVLAAQLAARVCSGPNMATCSSCGTVYFSSRKPRTDQNHYCEKCKSTAGTRRTQSWRERKRSTYS